MSGIRGAVVERMGKIIKADANERKIVAAIPTSATVNLMSVEQFKDWLDNTEANLTFVGDAIGDLSKRNALNTIVTYCSHRIHNICGGSCTVYTGGPACLNAAGTSCLAATSNVGFCDRGGCGGSCNQFSTCGTLLENNFCFTPGTQSILVGA